MAHRLPRVPRLVAGIAAVLAILATGCGKSKQTEPRSGGRAARSAMAQIAKNYSFSYSVSLPSTHIQVKTAEAWAREVEAQSQGRIKITIHAGGSPLEPAKIYDAVMQGDADIGMSCFAYTRGRFPLLEGLDLPLGYPDGKTATAIANAIVTRYSPKEIGDVHVLYVYASGPCVLATHKPVNTLADLKGLKVCAAGISGKVVERLGGNLVSMPQNDVYEALRKGAGDAVLCPAEALRGVRQGEALGAVVSIPSIGCATTMFVAMNMARWEALPPDLQQILTDVSREWAPKHGEAWDEADAAGLAAVAALGKAVQPLPKADVERAREAVKSIIDDYVKATEAAGLPAAQVLDDIRQQMKDLATPK
jgi:TRAP-type transport system periplasmic protein